MAYKKYAYYSKGNKIALIQEEIAGGNLEFKDDQGNIITRGSSDPSARNPYNQITNDALFPDLDLAEGGTNAIDFGSNFFKLRTDQVWLNASSSNNYIYAAYAENPFGGSGVNQGKAR